MATLVWNTEVGPHFSGIKPGTPASPALAGRFFLFFFNTESPGKPESL